MKQAQQHSQSRVQSPVLGMQIDFIGHVMLLTLILFAIASAIAGGPGELWDAFRDVANKLLGVESS